MVGIPDSRIFLIENGTSSGYQTLPELVRIGKSEPEIVPLRLGPGEARNKVALLNFSSGTSGLPKGVLITHRNVIANVCQISAQESGFDFEGQVSNGCLPFFHSIHLPVLAVLIRLSLRSCRPDALSIKFWCHRDRSTNLCSRCLRSRYPQVFQPPSDPR
jgi:acyl-CoA synthetase (AMP-forming)/AMP-acid ligase II